MLMNVLQSAALAAAIPTPVLQMTEDVSAFQLQDVSPRGVPATANFEATNIEARDRSRMTLQWSPEGRIMFLIGLVSLGH